MDIADLKPAASASAHGALALLASAVAGRGIEIRIGACPAAYTDGQAVFLPQGQAESWTLAAALHAALLGSGSLNPAIAARLLGHAAAAARYLTLEAARLARDHRSLLPRAVRERILAHWSGATGTGPDASLQQAAADRNIPPAPPAFGMLRPWALLRQELKEYRLPASQAEARQAERAVVTGQDEEDEDESAGERSPLLSKLTAPVNFDNPLGRLLKQLAGARRSRASDPRSGGSAFVPGAVRWVRQLGQSATKLVDTALRLDDAQGPEGGGAHYPEWDCQARAYLPDWCRVLHYEPALAAEAQPAPQDAALRRSLARLGMSYATHRRQGEGMDFDNDALTRFVVDEASGYSGDDYIYEARRKTARNLSAIVLLDASGSTSDQQQATGASVWEAQRTLAQAIVVALAGLGDMVAAYGFRSFGRRDLRFLRIKEFGERFDQAARGRLHGLKPAGYTRLGAAIRHAAHLVSSRSRAQTQLLVLVSDGLPFDIGYEDRHAEQDVRQALAEAEERGIACVCISVGSPRQASALERVWGNVGHACLAAPAELRLHALPLFRAALRRAARARPGSGARTPALSHGVHP